MTEQQVIEMAAKFGPWVGLAIAVTYIVVNKVGPQWITALIDERKAAQQATIEERRLEKKAAIEERQEDRRQREEMIKFIASTTEAINSMSESFTRSLDDNTRQLYVVSELVKIGPKCPLPECPLWKAKSETTK